MIMMMMMSWPRRDLRDRSAQWQLSHGERADTNVSFAGGGGPQERGAKSVLNGFGRKAIRNKTKSKQKAQALFDKIPHTKSRKKERPQEVPINNNK